MAIREMSEKLGITRKFLEAILLELRDHDILQSRMGKIGGCMMERAPEPRGSRALRCFFPFTKHIQTVALFNTE